ncbi:MAG TPA: putative oxidoreductase C-terminal domain-containing protein [Burkholderiales bacterium]|nr:putative oxidoreductase C-terminal domain-containing protein [Burkholderiales bacterium]
MAADKHTLVVLDPGHFHAALTLRLRHPRLSDDVHIYGTDGPDLQKFLQMVQTFNQRADNPTRWNLHIYRGNDHFERLCMERPGEVVIIAGRNDSKMASIHRLHADGFFVLGDKPWLIDPGQIGMLKEVAASPPLAMDIMTERHEIATRLQVALAAQPQVFGRLRDNGDQPAISMMSVHHLYKIVNGVPLVRPPWVFDVAVQGEGITDVTTHLVDLAQWICGGEDAADFDRDIELVSARQWPTEVPLSVYTRITGVEHFPETLRHRVSDDVLSYLCNAAIGFRLRGTAVAIESRWALSVPEGGGDTHYAEVRGTAANLVVEHSRRTHYVTELTVRPVDGGAVYAAAIGNAIDSLQGAFPGVGIKPLADGDFRITIPDALRTTHEQHFAKVLDRFLGRIDGGALSDNYGRALVTKYTLLARAAELARRSV